MSTTAEKIIQSISRDWMWLLGRSKNKNLAGGLLQNKAENITRFSDAELTCGDCFFFDLNRCRRMPPDEFTEWPLVFEHTPACGEHRVVHKAPSEEGEE